jgi:folylpolyglutamate synthase/dihydropteroate synthase
MAAATIADAARAAGLDVVVAASTTDALDVARRRLAPNGRLVVTGSLYVVAEARPLFVPSATGRQVSDALNQSFAAGGE